MGEASIYAVPSVHVREASIYAVPSHHEHIYDVPYATRAYVSPPAPRTDVGYSDVTPLESQASSTDSSAARTDCDSGVGLSTPFEIPDGMSQVYPPQEHAAALRLLMVQSADEKATESPYAAPTFRHRMSTAISASFRRARDKARRALRGVATAPEAALARRSLTASTPMLTAARPMSDLTGKRMAKDTSEATAGNSEAPRASFAKRLRGLVSRSFETIATFLRYAFQK
ncbi:hypothetical protein [Bordetella sp. LUAb4]|uniref:hypothetical protein n=1 Tax=Bordetella sp. LUAb4 TaxID=2843195 RepID=UPI001E39783C|nr:hypothetical protein [Bordetella sp. LUAb4]